MNTVLKKCIQNKGRRGKTFIFLSSAVVSSNSLSSWKVMLVVLKVVSVFSDQVSPSTVICKLGLALLPRAAMMVPTPEFSQNILCNQLGFQIQNTKVMMLKYSLQFK